MNNKLFIQAGILSFLWLIWLPQNASGQGTAQLMTAKSIPPATVAVIDPESGTSQGGGTTDVKVAPGDIIVFRFNYSSISKLGARGLQGYLTEYIPPNTRVVGARIIDKDGATIPPRLPGISINGCKGAACASFKDLPCDSTLPPMNPACNGNKRNLSPGSMSQLSADTGIFYTDDARLARNPGNAFITLNNGTLMSPQPSKANDIVAVLGANASAIYAHNAWDWIQVRAYGTGNAACGNGGYGVTPFLFGSPVAGPQTFYLYEATEPTAGTIQFNDTSGPWKRIRYAGSQIGYGTATHPNTLQRANTDTDLGLDVTPANPLPAGTVAIRYALGELRVGEPGYAEIALLVDDTPLDPGYGTSGGDVDCAEVFGSDLSAKSATDAQGNPWSFYLASPSCVYLNLLFDLTVDRPLATNNAPYNELTYTLRVKNLSLNQQTGVQIQQRFGNDLTYINGSASGNPAQTSNCAGDGRACLVWSIGTMEPSDEYTFTSKFNLVGASGGGAPTAVMFANYISAALPQPGFQTQAVTVTKDMAVIQMQLASQTPIASAGGTASFTGFVENAVIATGGATVSDLTLVLPSGWSINGGHIHLTLPSGGQTTCNTDNSNTPVCTLGVALEPDQRVRLSFDVNVPNGTSAGLYDLSAQTWSSIQSFGQFDSYFPNLATQAVGASRSNPPVVRCPINYTQTAIYGTTDAPLNAVIRVYLNGIQRGGDLVTSTSNWTLSSFSDFGALYPGVEIRATAQGAGQLESLPSAPCYAQVVLACSDGIDNDGDGYTDFPADIGCTGPTDNNEADHPQCADKVDNNTDGLTDYPADPSCTSPYDTTEDGVMECQDTLDNDDDGLTDYPADPGCESSSDPKETDFRACQNGKDDDGDGLTDYPDDPGCHSITDDDETDVSFDPGDVSPRLLLLFDTSGSMNWLPDTPTFTGGDGSLECPGVGGSRLELVKLGISDVLAAFGEIQYALMRYHQRPVPFACPSSNATLGSGGWQGSGAVPCGEFDKGDLLVRFAPDNAYSILEYMDGQSNYPAVSSPPAISWSMDFELRGTGTTPIAGSLGTALDYLTNEVGADDPYFGCRPYRVILITDGAETCGGDPVAKAAELKTAGIYVYVIGFATTDPEIVANLDAIAAAGSKDGNGTAIMANDSTELSMAMASIISDSILVERCNGVDDDCDGLTDEGFRIGEFCTAGTGACYAEGTIQCVSLDESACDAVAGTPGTEVCDDEIDNDCDGLTDEGCPSPCVPGPEICNGQDDDCDGLTDEPPLPSVGDACGIDVGECTTGTLACVDGKLQCSGQGPVPEECDGLDNDCDGFTDGFSKPCYEPPLGEDPVGCVVGTGCKGECRMGWAECLELSPGNYGFGTCDGQVTAAGELCNGLDDDCDGLTDEDWPALGTPCDNGQQYGCLLTGTIQCALDGASTYCTAPPITPGPEQCNGLDDDCDGETDEAEDLGAPVGNDCGGICLGKLICDKGEIVCSAQTGSPEVCDSLDNDCDGFIDEGDLPGAGEPCTAEGMEKLGDQGACEFGKTACINGKITCQGYIGPTEETCNGVDDNCDGKVDNEAICPSPDDICYEGVCISPCKEGEFTCGFGFFCDAIPQGMYCVPDPCMEIECGADEDCDRSSGECVDACLSVACKEGELCMSGVCVDCYKVPCESGQLCVANSLGVGVCQADACASAKCDPKTEVCDNGVCKSLRCSPDCKKDQLCVNGVCKTDKCAEVLCYSTQKCDPASGKCVKNSCLDVACSKGMVCVPESGRCEPDACKVTRCPAGTECKIRFDGSAFCQAPEKEQAGGETVETGEKIPRAVLAAGGGGCDCSIGAPRNRSGAGVLLLGMALAPLVWRRRARTRSRP